MPVMDEFKEQRSAIKNGSFKDKVNYFWYYYKLHTFIVIFVIVLGANFVHEMVTKKESAFFAVMLNSASTSEEQTVALAQNYAEYAGIDINEYDVFFDTTINFSTATADTFSPNINETTMSASEKLLAYTAAGEVDVIIGDSVIFPNQANQEMFHDLRDILSEAQYNKYEPYFYYIDQAYLDALAKAQDNFSANEKLNTSLWDIPDPTKPEEMQQPIPVGIIVTDCNTLTDAYQFGGDYTVLGVMVNTPHLEESLKFIDYIFE